MPTKYARGYRGYLVSSGPWVGVRDQIDPETFDPSYAQQMINLYPEEATIGTGLRARPAWLELTSEASPLNSGAQITGIYEHQAVDGTRYVYVFAGAKMYQYDGVANSFGDVTPSSGVAISASSKRVYCASFAGSMIVSDGINRPWKVTSHASTVVGAYLTGVPGALYGQPVVYYAKLFGIKANERNTIIWSEENDPDTGYEAGGYNNAWTLGQTSSDPLEALCATNAHLYYFRRASCGAISGAVNDDFVNSGVHDGVSEEFGTTWPASVLRYNNDIWFADQNGEPQVIRGTSIVEPSPSRGLRQTLKTVNLNVAGISPGFHAIQTVYLPETGLILMAHHLSGETVTNWLVFDPNTLETYDRWTSRSQQVTASTIAFLEKDDDAEGYRDYLFWGTEDGRVYRERADAGAVFQDVIDGEASTFPIGLLFTVGYDTRTEKNFQRLDVSMRQDVADTACTLSIGRRVPRGVLSSQNVAVNGPLGDTEAKGTIGMNAHGRWLEISIAESSNTGLRVINEVVIEGVETTDAPGLR